jgi:hypothetical protein
MLYLTSFIAFLLSFNLFSASIVSNELRDNQQNGISVIIVLDKPDEIADIFLNYSQKYSYESAWIANNNNTIQGSKNNNGAFEFVLGKFAPGSKVKYEISYSNHAGKLKKPKNLSQFSFGLSEKIISIAKIVPLKESDKGFVYEIEDPLTHKKVALKIMDDSSSNLDEIEIYAQLNENDNKHKNHVVKLLGFGKFSKSDSTVMVRAGEAGTFDISKISVDARIKINTFKIKNSSSNRSTVYMTTEFDENYLPLEKVISEYFKIENADKFCALMSGLYKTLNYLSGKYGFIHTDLSDENILINNNLKDFKLFDFDHSKTNNFGQNSLLSIRTLKEAYNSSPDKLKFGIYFDFYMMLHNFQMKSPSKDSDTELSLGSLLHKCVQSKDSDAEEAERFQMAYDAIRKFPGDSLGRDLMNRIKYALGLSER